MKASALQQLYIRQICPSASRFSFTDGWRCCSGVWRCNYILIGSVLFQFPFPGSRPTMGDNGVSRLVSVLLSSASLSLSLPLSFTKQICRFIPLCNLREEKGVVIVIWLLGRRKIEMFSLFFFFFPRRCPSPTRRLCRTRANSQCCHFPRQFYTGTGNWVMKMLLPPPIDELQNCPDAAEILSSGWLPCYTK